MEDDERLLSCKENSKTGRDSVCVYCIMLLHLLLNVVEEEAETNEECLGFIKLQTIRVLACTCYNNTSGDV